MNTRELGQRGEKLARRYLEAKGYRTLETNHRSRLGEIDLICKDRETIVFVEVKARSDDSVARPCESVGRHKQTKLRRLAEEYLVSHRIESSEARFDVLSVVVSGRTTRIEHLTGAF